MSEASNFTAEKLCLTTANFGLHFGARRQGRSGPSHRLSIVSSPPETDNVWDIDCSSFFPANVGGGAIHGAYFVTDATIELMRQVLRGIDRGMLINASVAPRPAGPS